VGFHPLPSRSKWDTSGAKPHVDRYEARMLETSLCSVPAYDDAGVLALRSAGFVESPETVIVPTPRLAEARAWLESLRRL
jgi:phage head maturation protease